VQYARYVHWRFDFIREDLETVERRTIAASPGGGAEPAAVQRLHDHWSTLRPDLIGRTVEMLEVLQRLEAHFPAAARLLRDTDAQGFLEDLHRQLQQGREAKIRGVILNVKSRQSETADT
jgi:hypothetical protein